MSRLENETTSPDDIENDIDLPSERVVLLYTHQLHRETNPAKRILQLLDRTFQVAHKGLAAIRGNLETDWF